MKTSCRHHQARGPARSAVLVAFLAGLLLGAPLAFCVLLLEGAADAGSAPSPSSPSLGPGGNWTRSRRLEHAAAEKPPTVDPGGRSGSRKEFPETGGASGNDSSSGWTSGPFWTARAEALVPAGFGEAEDSAFRLLLNASRVLRLEEGCGRAQNRLLVLTDGERACARRRINADQIQGEVFSFHLARMLGLRNLPPAALALPEPRNPRWAEASASMALARWTGRRPTVLTRFVSGLSPAGVPKPFRRTKGQRRLRPTGEDMEDLAPEDVGELVQWSDLLVFDYLTANLDRVVNNLFNERWDPLMMSARRPVHNLYRTGAGLLVFLDNESGLLHGYRLLGRYQPLHRGLLDGLCVFRAGTVGALDGLRKSGVGRALRKALAEKDPGMQDWLPFLPESSVRTLESRMDDVLERVRACRKIYPKP